MGILSIFHKSESVLGVDVGSSSLKLLELDLSGKVPRVVNFAYSQLSTDIITNNFVTNLSVVGEQLSSLLESNSISTKTAALAVPGPSVFIKKIKMPKANQDELERNIQVEAASFIPHNIDAIKLDFHVLGEVAKGQLEVLVVAVKNEIMQSYTDAVALGGLEPAVVDVDYFALQNAFERTQLEESQSKTVALVNIGAKYTAVNIIKGTHSLFTGDISVGGKNMTDGLASDLGISSKDAEEKKRASNKTEQVTEAFQKQCDHFASELNRQLSFFWNASAADDGIETIVLSGAPASNVQLVKAIASKTGINTVVFDPFEGIDISGVKDLQKLKELAPAFAVVTGLALRSPGDKESFVVSEQ